MTEKKIQLINLKDDDTPKIFGIGMKDPISLKKIKGIEKDVLQEKGFTHVWDYRTFVSMFEVFSKKYFLESLKNNRNIGVPTILSYNLNYEAWEVFHKNIYRRNLKTNKLWIDFVTLINEEVGNMNYHFYEMSFNRLNATNIEDWKKSHLLISNYMDSVNRLNIRVEDFILKKMEQNKIKTILNGSFKKNNKFSAAFGLIYRVMLEATDEVFWDENRKKEKSVEIIKLPYNYTVLFLENICGMHIKLFEKLKLKYNSGIIKNETDLDNGILNENENFTYRQFYLEAIIARTTLDFLDPIEIDDMTVLKEHGVSVNSFSLDIYYNKKHLTSLFEKEGGANQMENFKKFFRESDLNNKIEQINMVKDIKVRKKL